MIIAPRRDRGGRIPPRRMPRVAVVRTVGAVVRP